MKKILTRIKKSAKQLVAVFLILFLITGLWMKYFTNRAEAAWFDESFAYRKAITLTDSGAETNKYATLSSYDASDSTKYQSDCGDVRFTDSHGKLLKYTVSSCGATTTFHINMDAILSGTQTIYIYYGNPSASNGFISSDPYTACSGCSFGSPASEEKAPQPFAYWKFDDMSGTVAKDSTTHNHSVTFAGSSATPTWATKDVCISGGCVKFDGVDDYASSTTTLDLSSTSVITVEFWLKWKAYANDDSLAMELSSNTNTSTTGFFIDPNGASGNFTVSMKGDVGYSSIDFTRPSSGVWHHYVIVLDKTQASGAEIKPYVDGVAVSTTALSSSDNTNTFGTNTLYFMSRAGSSLFGAGLLDDVKIYPYARSATQAKGDFTGVTALGGSSLGSDPNTARLGGVNYQMTHYYKFDESSWTNDCSTKTIKDSGGAADLTSCPNTTGPTSTTVGKYGNAANFDGVDDEADAASQESYGKRWTISEWFKTTDTQGYLFDSRDQVDGGQNGIAVYTDGANTFTFYQNMSNVTTKTYTYTSATLDGNWHHLVVTRDGDNSISFYIDKTKLTPTTTPTDTDISANSEIWGGIHYGNRNTGNIYPLSGSIDEARIYARSFTQTDVNTLYDYGPLPVEEWGFDEKTGSTVSDTTGVNTLTWSGSGSHWTTGKLGNAGKFNGSDDVLSKSSPTGLPTGGQARTISLWIKPDNSNPGGTLIHYGDGAGGGQEFVLSMITVSGTTYLFTDGVNGNNNISLSGSQIPTNGVWSHIEFTIDGTKWTYYLNGALITYGFYGTAINTATPTILNIGDRTDSPQTNYPGLIDNIKIYNYARTGKQVAEDMNNGYPATGSMVGYWKFDEGADNTCSGGTNDFCNSGTAGAVIDGTNVGATRTLSGKFGKAITTNGSTTYAQIPDNDLIDFDVTQDYTVSFWMKDGGGNANQSSIVEKWDGGGGFPYSFRYNTGGIISFANYDGTRSSTVSSTASVNSGWHHVVGVHNVNTDKLYLYIDGVLQGSATDNLLTTSRNSSPVCIGGRCVSGFDWAGTVDELKIYNFALTSDDVKVDYNHGASQSFGSVGTDASGNPSNSADRAYCPPGDTTATCGPVGEWNFEEGQGSSVKDSSGNGNTGTWSGSGDPHWMSGKVGKAGNFNSSDDTVTVNDSSLLQFGTGNFTVSAWVYPRTVDAGASDQMTILSKNYTGFEYFIYQGKLDAYLGGTPISVSGNKAIIPNQWYFVTLVRSGSSVTSYINAVQDAQATNSNNVSNIGTNVSIGQRTGSSTYAFDGKLDQVRVYNYARSGAQIAWDYNRGAPLAWWKMDECQGSTIHDAAAGGNDASVTIGGSGSQTSLGTCQTSGTAWGNGAAGKLNSSLSFDGTDDYATVNSANTAITGSLTVSAWIKPSSVAGSEIMSKGDAANFYRMQYSGGNMRFETFGLSNQDLTSVTAPPLGQWTHVTMVYDGSTKKIYINGKLDTSISVTGSITSGGVSTIYIGGFGFGSGEYFPGSLDDLRIYNYALTQAQINSLYNGGAAVRFGPVTGTP